MKVRNRIKKSDEFQDVIKRGKSLKSRTVTLFYQSGASDRLRVGISVPTKLGHAVKRNKVKRQIRSIVAEDADLGKVLDVVIIARLSYDAGNYAGTKKELGSLFLKAGFAK